MTTAAMPTFGPLRENIRADVCVVGAGIAGLTTAYLLAKEGRAVVVLDDGPIVSGETERTTAHLSNALDERFIELERMHGVVGARLAAESHGTAVDTIERICGEERIECDFTRLDGYLFNPRDGKGVLLERELEAAHRAGLTDVELVERAPLVSFNTGPALLFPRQAQCHPLKYLAAVAQSVVRLGGRIFTYAHATQVKGGRNASVRVADGFRVDCGAVVVATNTPVNDLLAIHTKQRPYRTYVIGVTVPVGTVPRVLYWDTEDPYHYVRLQTGGTDEPGSRDLLLVGGEDHQTGQANDAEGRFARLELWTRRRFPMAGEIHHRWSGQVLEPADGLAFIGRNPMDDDNVFVATGDSGHGMTHGTIAGILLTDLIQGRANRWADLYNPSRSEVRAPMTFLADNLNMAAQYLDWLTAGDAEKEALIARGSGAVVRHGLTKIAVYRDDNGVFHECSAVCPHLQAIVHWNGMEKTWDCPAHGSRFDRFGNVLNGPANSNLVPVTAHAEPRTPGE